MGKTSEATCDGSDGKIKFSASVTCRAPKTCTADAFPSIPSDKNLKKTSVDPGTTKEFESYTLECKPGSKQSDDKTTFDLPCEKDGAWASSPGQISKCDSLPNTNIMKRNADASFVNCSVVEFVGFIN